MELIDVGVVEEDDLTRGAARRGARRARERALPCECCRKGGGDERTPRQGLGEGVAEDVGGVTVIMGVRFDLALLSEDCGRPPSMPKLPTRRRGRA
jgi:hypothetical protein